MDGLKSTQRRTKKPIKEFITGIKTTFPPELPESKATSLAGFRAPRSYAYVTVKTKELNRRPNVEKLVVIYAKCINHAIYAQGGDRWTWERSQRESCLLVVPSLSYPRV